MLDVDTIKFLCLGSKLIVFSCCFISQGLQLNVVPGNGQGWRMNEPVIFPAGRRIVGGVVVVVVVLVVVVVVASVVVGQSSSEPSWQSS